MKLAALSLHDGLPHLNNRTASRHIFLFSCDGMFVNKDLHPLLTKSIVVHLGDDAYIAADNTHVRGRRFIYRDELHIVTRGAVLLSAHCGAMR